MQSMFANSISSTNDFLLSIIIPMYNAESYLAMRMQHLLTHNHEVVQVVIINDGSTDSSLEICKHIFKDAHNVIIISQENRGLSEARNRGMAMAKGEYILFLDSDDILLQEGFIELKTFLSHNKPDVLMGKYVLLFENGKQQWPSYLFPQIDTIQEARDYIYTNIQDSIWNATRYVCKREFLVNNGIFFVPGLICEDLEWTPRMLSLADTITFLNIPFYGYFYNRVGSITRTVLVKRIKDVNNIVSAAIPKYINEPYGQAIAQRLIKESFYNISRYCLCNKEERQVVHTEIQSMASLYRHSPSWDVYIFLCTRKVVPLYVWSLMLHVARKIRRFFNR